MPNVCKSQRFTIVHYEQSPMNCMVLNLNEHLCLTEGSNPSLSAKLLLLLPLGINTHFRSNVCQNADKALNYREHSGNNAQASRISSIGAGEVQFTRSRQKMAPSGNIWTGFQTSAFFRSIFSILGIQTRHGCQVYRQKTDT
jgi:hypothetical protein